MPGKPSLETTVASREAVEFAEPASEEKPEDQELAALCDQAPLTSAYLAAFGAALGALLPKKLAPQFEHDREGDREQAREAVRMAVFIAEYAEDAIEQGGAAARDSAGAETFVRPAGPTNRHSELAEEADPRYEGALAPSLAKPYNAASNRGGCP